jgi:phage FluMu gp28-like protein
MKITSLLTPLLAGLVLAFAACERKTVVIVEPAAPDPVAKTRTFETAALKSSIDAYEHVPTEEKAADVRKSFAELDSEIAELEARVARETGEDRAEAAQKLANLTAYRTAESARFVKAQATPREIRVDPRSGLQKAEDAARKTGETVKDAAEKVGDTIKDIAR